MYKTENAIDKIIEKHPNLTRDVLIPIMQEIQDEYGYLSQEAILILSKRFKLPPSKIYGLATFYNQFRFQQKGKYHIQVCNGSSCHLTASHKIIKEIKKDLQIDDGETTRDKKFSLEILPCIGACGQSPVIAINNEYFTKLNISKLKEILHFYKEA